MITTNSLGQRIAKTDEQIRAFWRWFGDSKVVDAKGRPLVMYHGVESATADFSVFRPSRTGALGPGIYATSDVTVANEYTGAPWKRKTPCQRIYPVYMKLLNPFIEGGDGPGMWDTFNPRRENVDDAEVQRRMISAGHDGIIGIGGAVNVAAKRGKIDAVAFDPTQIKSVTGNRGTFDSSDPVISNPGHPLTRSGRSTAMITTNSLGKPIAKTDEQIRAFWRWFGDSKVVDARGRPLVVYHSTNADFDAFSSSKIKQGAFGHGFYFAQRWGKNKVERYGSKTMQCYLCIRNPASNTDVSKALDAVEGKAEPFSKAQSRMVSIHLRKQGFDGVGMRVAPGETDWIAFRPTQIKSATSNRGTFDPSDPVINNPPIPHEPTHLAGMRVLRGFRPAAQQHEHTCGPACLRAVLAYYAQNADEADLARAAGTTKTNGTTPAGMLRVLRASRPAVMMKRGATVAWCLRQLRRSRPVLLLWNDWKGHWVVLIGYDPKTRRLLLADPANRRTGLRVHTPATLNRHWKARVGGWVYRRLAIAVG